jgi:hypothetical protein
MARCRHSAHLALVLVLTSICFAPARAAQRISTTAPNEQIARFLAQVARSGYLVQEGDFSVADLDFGYCSGANWSSFYPNPGSPYFNAALPPSPLQTEPNWTPANFRLREDEAMVVIGTTPPLSAYFALQTTMLKGSLRKDVGPPVLWVGVTDPINNRTIRTTGATPFSQPFVVTSTGHKRTSNEVHAMLRSAGLEAAINDEPIAPALFQLGLDKDAEQFAFSVRVAVPTNEVDIDAYVDAFKNPVREQRPIRVFRVRPAIAGKDQMQPVYAPDPLPVPQVRIAGTGKSELDTYPTLQLLRRRIIDAYSATHNYTEVEIDPGLEAPYSGLQRAKGYSNFPLQDGVMTGATDAMYLGSANFSLPDGAFLVAYGANHQATGKATYSAVAVYADPVAAVSLATVQSLDLQGSAGDFISDQPNAGLFYAWTFTRGANSGAHVTQLMTNGSSEKYCQTRYGLNQPVDLNTVRIWARSYMEPATNTHPFESEMILDRILVFTPK